MNVKNTTRIPDQSLLKIQCEYENTCIKTLVNIFRGNLGNKMSTYKLLYLLKLKYGYDVYVTKKVHDHLNLVFENLGNVLWIPSKMF